MSFGFFAVILGPLMRLVYGILPNFAVTLIVFTILVRVVSLPLNIKQQKSMAKTAVFQPLMTEIQEKYKNNQQKQQEELMKLQQEYGFNPMAGCWPMLLDMVVLFGVIEVVYRPVRYILGIPADVINQACEQLGLSGNFNALQTSLIQAIHNGAAQPAALTTEQYLSIKNFNTMFFGIDMCDIAGLRLTPLMIFPIAAAVTMFLSVWLTQKITGTAGQMQGGMKYMMWFMNAWFIYYCFTVPVGFSVYYTTSNICMVLRTAFTNKVYNVDRYKAEYEAELAAKKAASKAKKKVLVKENGKEVVKELPQRDIDRIRLERARALAAEKYAGERTTPLTEAEKAEQEAAKPQKKRVLK